MSKNEKLTENVVINTTNNTNNGLEIEELKDIGIQNEIWKPINGYNGIYEISSKARVKSIQRLNIRGRLVYGGFLTGSLDAYGYLKVKLSKDGQHKNVFVHRLVAKHFIDNPKQLATVNHKDGNKLNNNLNNLEWCSKQDNTKHAWKNKLINVEIVCRGEKHGNALFTNEQILEIKKLRSNGVYLKDIARIFNSNISTISNIVKNRNWKHII